MGERQSYGEGTMIRTRLRRLLLHKSEQSTVHENSDVLKHTASIEQHHDAWPFGRSQWQVALAIRMPFSLTRSQRWPCCRRRRLGSGRRSVQSRPPPSRRRRRRRCRGLACLPFGGRCVVRRSLSSASAVPWLCIDDQIASTERRIPYFIKFLNIAIVSVGRDVNVVRLREKQTRR